MGKTRINGEGARGRRDKFKEMVSPLGKGEQTRGSPKQEKGRKRGKGVKEKKILVERERRKETPGGKEGSGGHQEGIGGKKE